MTAGRTNHTRFAAAPAQPIAYPAPSGDWGSVDLPPSPFTLTHCASDNDGDCVHAQCPQLRDGEPKATGRSCPLYNWEGWAE